MIHSECLGTLNGKGIGARYVTSRCRVLTGLESLALQSISVEPNEIAGMTERHLKDLAGNAFESASCAAVFFNAILLLSHGSHQRLSRTEACNCEALAAASSASDSSISDVWNIPNI